jgi:hypothetical protein
VLPLLALALTAAPIQALARASQHRTYVELPGDHFVLVEQREAWAQAMASWLGQLEPARR